MEQIKGNIFLSEEDKAYWRSSTRRALTARIMVIYRALVQKEGLTQAELARRLNVSPSQISKLFNNQGNWTFDTISDLLTAMNAQVRMSKNIDKNSLDFIMRDDELRKNGMIVDLKSAANLPETKLRYPTLDTEALPHAKK